MELRKLPGRLAAPLTAEEKECPGSSQLAAALETARFLLGSQDVDGLALDRLVEDCLLTAEPPEQLQEFDVLVMTAVTSEAKSGHCPKPVQIWFDQQTQALCMDLNYALAVKRCC